MIKAAEKKSMALTTLLAILVMGAGHIYVGKVKSGTVIVVIGVAAFFIMSFVPYFLTSDGDLTKLVESDISTALLLLCFTIGIVVLFVWQIVNARKECRKYNSSIV